MTFDPRLTPARPDLAAAHLRGQVEAARFVEGVVQEVIAGHAPLREEPSHAGRLVSEALHGERVTVYETDDEGWAWGQLMSDGYVGWLPAAALLAPGAEPTHKVTALRTLVFPGPSIKLPPSHALPLGAQIAVVGENAGLAVTAAGGYVPSRHLARIGAAERDHVAVAERFLGVPYLWGGKTTLGIDCSGLVQVALTACGVPCPRDSDMQEQAIGSPVAASDPQRGDLLFWEGHVAIVRDRRTLLHANAYHMQVAIEPLSEAVARIQASGSEITSVRRLVSTALLRTDQAQGG
jgi:cell wall-associated NlpC family hydrolase